jgi:hypothetical protein
MTKLVQFCVALNCAWVVGLNLKAADPGRPNLQSASALPSTPHSHWAFAKPHRPPLPKTTPAQWSRSPIDYFVLERLEKEGLAASTDTDRATLIRRLTFGLIGLAPSPEEVQAFLAESDPDAYEKLVDRLLASPRYGERWARHWLDVVRFAESHGFETNIERKNAWPYRDYVIRAFNEDKPYHQFVLEQLAGDAFGVDEATGFIVGGPWDAVKSPDINLTSQQRMDELHDMVATTASTFLGLTAGCARCHDHKFDPISQRDYYAMQAVFAGVQHGDRILRPADYQRRMNEADSLRQRVALIDAKLDELDPLADPSPSRSPQSSPRRRAVHPRQNFERFPPSLARFLRFTVSETTGAEPCIDELEVYTSGDSPPRNVALASQGAKASASGTYPNSEIHKLEHLNDGKVGNARSWISNESGKGWVQLEFPSRVSVNKVVWGRDREEKYADRLATHYKIEVSLDGADWKIVAASNDRAPFVRNPKAETLNTLGVLTPQEAEQAKPLLAEKKKHEEKIRALTTFPALYAGKFEKPAPTHRLHRGEAMQKRELINPGGIKGIGPEFELPGDGPEQDRRLALARWLTDPANPLTARVIVNRIWHYHFGRGLVATPSDFGLNGARPTHPELLDWLASEFVRQGWSIKAIHRLIVLSSTYRQASTMNSAAFANDADNQLLWRFPPRRLEAEPLRDTILLISGNLNLKTGGPGFDLFEPNSNYVKVYNAKKEFGPPEWRRMIYQAKPRMRLDDVFGAFDCPDAGQIAPIRTSSTTPLQAFNLMNSPFITQQAALFAERLRTEAGTEVKAQVRWAFWLALSRGPSSEELQASERLIRQHGAVHFCRALFNANEFVYVF